MNGVRFRFIDVLRLLVTVVVRIIVIFAGILRTLQLRTSPRLTMSLRIIIIFLGASSEGRTNEVCATRHMIVIARSSVERLDLAVKETRFSQLGIWRISM